METINVEIYPGREVTAYTPECLPELRRLGKEAEDRWAEDWRDQGAVDLGTCCIGKGLRVYVANAGDKRPREVTIARGDFVQGNVAAYQTHHVALQYLAEMGVEAEYYDGRMD